MKSISERLKTILLHEVKEEEKVIEEEQYDITLPFKGPNANNIINSLGVQVRKDDDTADLKGRVYTVVSTPKSGDAITIRQRLDAAMKKANMDPKLAHFKVTAL